MHVLSKSMMVWWGALVPVESPGPLHMELTHILSTRRISNQSDCMLLQKFNFWHLPSRSRCWGGNPTGQRGTPAYRLDLDVWVRTRQVRERQPTVSMEMLGWEPDRSENASLPSRWRCWGRNQTGQRAPAYRLDGDVGVGTRQVRERRQPTVSMEMLGWEPDRSERGASLPSWWRCWGGNPTGQKGTPAYRFDGDVGVGTRQVREGRQPPEEVRPRTVPKRRQQADSHTTVQCCPAQRSVDYRPKSVKWTSNNVEILQLLLCSLVNNFRKQPAYSKSPFTPITPPWDGWRN